MRRKTSREGKGRINVWLEKRTLEALRAEARARSVPVQSLIEGAVGLLFQPEAREERDGLILRRLNQIDLGVKALERLVEVTAEVMAFFIRGWFCHTPDLPAEKQDAATFQAMVRYERFCRRLGNRLMNGSIFADLPAGVFGAETFLGLGRTSVGLERKGHEEEK